MQKLLSTQVSFAWCWQPPTFPSQFPFTNQTLMFFLLLLYQSSLYLSTKSVNCRAIFKSCRVCLPQPLESLEGKFTAGKPLAQRWGAAKMHIPALHRLWGWSSGRGFWGRSGADPKIPVGAAREALSSAPGPMAGLCVLPRPVSL